MSREKSEWFIFGWLAGMFCGIFLVMLNTYLHWMFEPRPDPRLAEAIDTIAKQRQCLDALTENLRKCEEAKQ